jgi:hypothetical protein
VFVVVGDVVASRRILDTAALLRGLQAGLDRVNEDVDGALPLTLVVRDEFHGVYDTLSHALEAALRLRLYAGDLVLDTTDGEPEPVDVRVGLGAGDAVVGNTGTPSGTAWFHARDAKHLAQELPGKAKWPPSLRTVCRSDDPGFEALVNAYLICQDQLLARMDTRDRRALRGLLDGERQVDVADDLGVTQPAIARRVKDRGALALHRSLQALALVTDPSSTSTIPDQTHQGAPSHG